jgi:hypothetical protein
MDVLESNILLHVVVFYATVDQNANAHEFDFNLNNYLESLMYLLHVNGQTKSSLTRLIQILKKLEPTDLRKIDVMDKIYDVWNAQTFSIPDIENLFKLYNKNKKNIKKQDSFNMLTTNFTEQRLSQMLKEIACLLFIQLNSNKKSFNDYYSLSTSLCALSSKLVQANEPYRDFACFDFNIPEKQQHMPSEPQKSSGRLSKSVSVLKYPFSRDIEKFYSDLSKESNEDIFYTMTQHELFFYITFNFNLFCLEFGFPSQIAIKNTSFILDCWHPLLDRIVDSGIIIDVFPNKGITELLAVNFDYKLAFHKFKKCPNYKTIPIPKPLGRNPVPPESSQNELYRIYNIVSDEIINFTTTFLLREISAKPIMFDGKYRARLINA